MLKTTGWAGKTRKRIPLPDRKVQTDCRCRNAFGEVGTKEEMVLDVRDLSIHGQIGRTLERAELLKEGETLRQINSSVPWPLFAMLETRGYRYRLIGRRHGEIHIIIWRWRRVSR